MINVYEGQGRLANYLHIRRNPLGFLSDVVRTCGDFAQVDVLLYRFYVINDPALIHEALVEHSETLIIKGGVSAGLARLIGNGILTNHGARWRESRTTLQPLFHKSQLVDQVSIIALRVQESIDRWHSHFAGQQIAINRELLALSFRITCSTLFHCVPSFDDAEQFADAMWVLQLDGMQRHLAAIDMVEWLPSAMNRRVQRARDTIVRLGEQIAAPQSNPPLDEVLSILFAGTESPVNTLCFGLKLLNEHPETRQQLIDDLTQHSSREGVPDIESCALLSQVVYESMRLFPAGWAFERFASADLQLGGQRIAQGSRLLFSPFLMHRNARFWNEPEQFMPTRFAAGSMSVQGVPKYGYMPFGAGPRSCIGSRMALAEMRITLGMILTQCDCRIVTEQSEPALQAEGSFKIRLSRPLAVTMNPRSSGTSVQTQRGN